MEIPEPKAFLMPQDYEKGIKLQFVPFSDSKDCLKAEKKTSATNKEFQQYSLAVKTEAGEYYELNFLMLSSFTKIYKDYGKKSENWLNNWVEAK